jgi:hypothetical protein
VFGAGAVVDLIWSSGNGIAMVDHAWFRHATPATVLDRPVRLCPAEEMVWSKAFIMERERFDGPDIAHLLRARGRSMRWRWLVRRFGPHWPVLLSHLILLRFVYPGEAPAPEWATALLVRRLQRERRPSATAAPICMGHAPVPRSVPDRRAALGLPRRPTAALRPHARGKTCGAGQRRSTRRRRRGAR